MRAAIARAQFTGKGDRSAVTTLYHEYVVDLANAVTDIGHRIGFEWPKTYEGETDAKDRPHGFGTLTYADGTGYEGQWDKGDYHGQGVLRHATGDVYDGEYVHDDENGHGIYTQPDGYLYVGSWAKSCKHGPGTAWYSEGDKRGPAYEGEWKGDEWHGLGTSWCGRRVLTGQFQESEFNGLGLQYDDEGTVVAAKFEDGAPVGVGVQWSADRETVHRLEFVDHDQHVEHVFKEALSQSAARALLQGLIGNKKLPTAEASCCRRTLPQSAASAPRTTAAATADS